MQKFHILFLCEKRNVFFLSTVRWNGNSLQLHRSSISYVPQFFSTVFTSILLPSRYYRFPCYVRSFCNIFHVLNMCGCVCEWWRSIACFVVYRNKCSPKACVCAHRLLFRWFFSLTLSGFSEAHMALYRFSQIYISVETFKTGSPLYV